MQNQTDSSDSPTNSKRRHDWRRSVIGLGAAAAIGSATLAVLANLSEIAGWFSPDETQELVKQTRVVIEDTDAKVNELINLLRNQAAAGGADLNIESETAIRNAIQTIIASGNAQKQTALTHLNEGDVATAAEMMSRIAENQAVAVSQTSDAAAATWREAGALYFSNDVARAIHSYEQANLLQPGHSQTLEMLGHSLLRAGRVNEARTVFQQCLASHPPADLRASVHHGFGNIAKLAGDYATAIEHYTQAQQISEENGLAAEQAQALVSLAVVARAQGNLDLAGRYLQRALARAVDMNNEMLRAKILTNLGTIAASRENYDEAERHISEALAIHRIANDLAGQANAMGNLGAVALLRGDVENAEALLLESVQIGERLGWQESVAYDLVNLGGMALERRDFESADNFLEKAERFAQQAELGELAPVIIFNRGEIAIERGQTELACRFWLEAEPLLVAMGSGHAETAATKINAAQCDRGSIDR